MIENHLISADIKDLPEEFMPYKHQLAGRFMLVKKLEMFDIECIVRGYLAGSGLREYQTQGSVCGIALPSGLQNSSKLPSTLFTPSTKAEIGDHDENISYEKCEDLIGKTDASRLRDASIKIYERARDYAASRGIIIADTKFEFGTLDGALVLGDEVLTPDSSRFWPASTYSEGKDQPSFDKQFVRDWLRTNWNGEGVPPRLPRDIIDKTSEKYISAYELLTGQKFAPAS